MALKGTDRPRSSGLVKGDVVLTRTWGDGRVRPSTVLKGSQWRMVEAVEAERVQQWSNIRSRRVYRVTFADDERAEGIDQGQTWTRRRPEQ